MERSAFAGSRIRERRVALGLRQAEVALRAAVVVVGDGLRSRLQP